MSYFVIFPFFLFLIFLRPPHTLACSSASAKQILAFAFFYLHRILYCLCLSFDQSKSRIVSPSIFIRYFNMETTVSSEADSSSLTFLAFGLVLVRDITSC